jgi:hypothetical protein
MLMGIATFLVAFVGEANEIGAERGKCRRERLLVREIELCEYEASRSAAEERVVPFDGGANCRCDNGLRLELKASSGDAMATAKRYGVKPHPRVENV